MLQQNAEQQILVRFDDASHEGILWIPPGAQGVVLFAPGSEGPFSPRDNFVSNMLHQRDLATLLVDLPSPGEDESNENRFNIDLLTQQLASAAEWIKGDYRVRDLPLGLFAAGTGAAAALQLAAWLKEGIFAVVCQGGRPDLAGEFLSRVTAPTLLIVGGDDDVVYELNRRAYEQLRAESEFTVIPGATHLYEEPGALEAVADKVGEWFMQHLPPAKEPSRLLRAG